jgi:predicted nucleotidyltransferase
VASNPDFKDLLRALNEEGAKYLLIGGYAVAFYTEPRYTKDFDLWIASDLQNVDRVWKALSNFGAPLSQIQKTDLSDPETIYQIGIAPNRIDILVQPGPVSFEEAWKQRSTTSYDGEPLYVASVTDLIRLKAKAGRPVDIEDIKALKKLSTKK